MLHQMYIELVSKQETLLSPFVAKRLLAEAEKESAAWRQQLADLDKQAVSTLELKYHVLDQLFLASQYHFIRRFIPLGTRSPCGVNTYFPIVKESSSKIYQAGDTVKLELGVAQQLYDLDAARVCFVVGGDTVKMDSGSRGYYEQVLTHKDRQRIPIDLLIVNGLTGEHMRTSLDYQLQGQ